MTSASSEYIEDLLESPNDADNVLTHNDLVEGGLAPIKAYARTRSSKAALRAKRHRERMETGEGKTPPKKQLNVMVPPNDEARTAVKAVAEALLEGRMKPADVQDVGSDVVRLGHATKRVLSRGGIRAAALRMLIGWNS